MVKIHLYCRLRKLKSNIILYYYKEMSRLLVLFVYHIYNDRVKDFIKNSIFYDENVDFIIISNNTSHPDELIYIPSNVKILHRSNIGYDFGGWSDALLTNNLYQSYDNFICVNSSVIGPFMPSSYSGKWTDIYINGLQDNIKLFGSTINTMGDPLNNPHVQSYIFSMDIITLKYLIDCGIFSITSYAKTFDDAIWNKEVLMSRKIIENGWNIGSLLTCYKNIDFTFSTKSPNEYNVEYMDDVMFERYRNVWWNEYQLVFVKGNRVNIKKI